jgi:hypothetical protein
MTPAQLRALIRSRIEPDTSPEARRRNCLRVVAMDSEDMLDYLCLSTPTQARAELADPASLLYSDRAAILAALRGQSTP